MSPQQKKPVISEHDYLNRLLTEKEAASFLSFTTRTLQGWRVKGGGPKFVKVNHRSVRYRRRDLMEWINQHVKISTSDPFLKSIVE